MGVNSLPWYFIPALEGPGHRVTLAGDEWHHCHQVLRMAAGDSLILTDGLGHCMQGIIRSASKNEGIIDLTLDQREAFFISRPDKLTIAFSPTKSIDRTEFAVEKLTELGIDRICFLNCAHSERSRIRMDRMEKIMHSAAKQSRKLFFPLLEDLQTPESLIARMKGDQPGIQIFCCHLDESSIPLVQNYSGHGDVLVLIGPEGGFSEQEIEQMKNLQASMVTLGPSRLRVETAAITACATIHALELLKLST